MNETRSLAAAEAILVAGAGTATARPVPFRIGGARRDLARPALPAAPIGGGSASLVRVLLQVPWSGKRSSFSPFSMFSGCPSRCGP